MIQSIFNKKERLEASIDPLFGSCLQHETALFQGDLGRVLTEIRLVKSSLAESLKQTQGKSASPN